MQIIDCHTHVYPDRIAEKAAAGLADFYQFRVDGKGTYGELEKEGAKAGITGFLLFCVATNARQVPKVNDSVAEFVALSVGHGFHTVGFAGMHQDFENVGDELDRCLALGLTGVKLHPDIQRCNVDDDRFLRLYEEMAKRDMILTLHVGDNREEYRYSSAGRVRRVAEKFPELKIIAAHFGGYQDWDGEAPLLRGLENVYFDCSSTFWALPEEKSVALIRACGADRVLYASDYPVRLPGDYLNLFLSLPLTEEEREAILWKNADRLLFHGALSRAENVVSAEEKR